MSKKRFEGGKKKRKWLRRLLFLAFLAVVANAIARRQKPGPSIPAGEAGERVIVKDEENLSGLGSIMLALFTQMLEDPAKLAILDGLNLSLAIEPIEQPETAITMTFSDGYVILEPGVAPDIDIHLVCEVPVLMQMATVGSGLAAARFMASPEGRELAGKFRRGELKVKGLAKHPVAMMRFTRFLAPAGG